MNLITIDSQELKLPVANIQDVTVSDWKGRQVTLNLNDNEIMSKVGSQVCNRWQWICSGFLSLFCCCGLSEKYLAKIGVQWCETKAKEGFGSTQGDRYSYVEKIHRVARDTLNPEARQSQTSQPSSTPQSRWSS